MLEKDTRISGGENIMGMSLIMFSAALQQKYHPKTSSKCYAGEPRGNN